MGCVGVSPVPPWVLPQVPWVYIVGFSVGSAMGCARGLWTPQVLWGFPSSLGSAGLAAVSPTVGFHRSCRRFLPRSSVGSATVSAVGSAMGSAFWVEGAAEAAIVPVALAALSTAVEEFPRRCPPLTYSRLSCGSKQGSSMPKAKRSRSANRTALPLSALCVILVFGKREPTCSDITHISATVAHGQLSQSGGARHHTCVTTC